MFEYLAPTATAMTTNETTAPLTSQASIYSINPSAFATSLASTVSSTLTASAGPLATTDSASPTAPTSISASPVPSTLANHMTHTTSFVSMTSPSCATTSLAAIVSLAPCAPAAAETTATIPKAAKVALSTVKIITFILAHSPAASQDTICANSTVRLGTNRVEPPHSPPDKQHYSGEVLNHQRRPQPNLPSNQKRPPLPSH